MNEKLPFICKKGCCIKQRVLIENAKAKYHDRLKRLHNQLATSIQKWLNLNLNLSINIYIYAIIFYQPNNIY